MIDSTSLVLIFKVRSFFAVALRKKETVVLYCSANSRSFDRFVEYTEGNSFNNLFWVTSGRDLNTRNLSFLIKFLFSFLFIPSVAFTILKRYSLLHVLFSCLTTTSVGAKVMLATSLMSIESLLSPLTNFVESLSLLVISFT